MAVRDNAVSVAQLLDSGRLTGYQQWRVALVALTIVFDGIDNQLLGIVIPTLMGGVARPAPRLRPGRVARLPWHDGRRPGGRPGRRSDRPSRRAPRQHDPVWRVDRCRGVRQLARDDGRPPVSGRHRPGRRDAECRDARGRVCPDPAAAAGCHDHHRLCAARRHAGGSARDPGAARDRLAQPVHCRRARADCRGDRAAVHPAGIAALSRATRAPVAGAHRRTGKDGTHAHTWRRVRRSIRTRDAAEGVHRFPLPHRIPPRHACALGRLLFVPARRLPLFQLAHDAPHWRRLQPRDGQRRHHALQPRRRRRRARRRRDHRPVWFEAGHARNDA